MDITSCMSFKKTKQIMIKGLYETHLYVENLENSIEFYSNEEKRVVTYEEWLEIKDE